VERIERAEFWLLDVVVRMWYPLYLLVDEEIELIFNRAGHGLSHEELAEALYRLFQKGDVIAGDIVEGELLDEFVPSREQIESALVDEERVFYGLTPQGGVRWEEYAKPDWGWYVNASYDTDESGRGKVDIEGVSRQRVAEYLSLHYEHYVMPDTTAREGSEEWEKLTPWQVFYWKTLSEGYLGRFAYEREQDALAVQRRYLQHRPPWVDEWLRRRDNWYTKYPEA